MTKSGRAGHMNPARLAFGVVPMSNNLTRTERAILRIIVKEEIIRSDVLNKQLNRNSTRTISAAVASLKRKGLVRRIPDLRDMRFSFFVLSEELASRLKARMEAPITPY